MFAVARYSIVIIFSMSIILYALIYSDYKVYPQLSTLILKMTVLLDFFV